MPKTKRNNSLSEDVDLQPWFLPKPVASQIRKILPSVHLAKMRYYFDDHGCLRCERRDVMYQRNGLCENCGNTIRLRVTASLKRRLLAVGSGAREPYVDVLGDAVESARKIVGKRRSR
jgi:hypothetical protein